MSLEYAIRLTEILLGFTYVLQSIEHFKSFSYERYLFILRFFLSLLLLVGFQTGWIGALLLLLGLFILHRFSGPYNGGSDRMSLLILCCLCLVYIAPTLFLKELAFSYLALQLILSYFISGSVKLINPDWRNGRALTDVFLFSAYPVSESLRNFSNSPYLLLTMSWFVILIEILFPLSLYSNTSLIIMLLITTFFHFANACLFGLNRFFWIWISAYPALIWFQQRIFDTL